MSRPRSSVPIAWFHVPPNPTGGWSEAARSISFGGYGSTYGAKRPAKMNSARIVPENHGQRRRRRRDTGPTMSSAGAWSASSVTASSGTGNTTAEPPHSRVEQSVRDVDEEQEHHEDGGVHEHDALDHVVVARVDPLDRQLADARPGEDGLHDDGRRDQRSQEDPSERDDRQRGVPQRVHDEEARRYSFRVHEQRVVLAHPLEDRRAGEARHRGQGERAEGNGGQDEMLPAALPERR